MAASVVDRAIGWAVMLASAALVIVVAYQLLVFLFTLGVR